jgi:branched-chain amino acid transport system ATP-binding protein
MPTSSEPLRSPHYEENLVDGVSDIAQDSKTDRPTSLADVGPVIECLDLDVGYGALTAGRSLNLKVHAGEVVALIGPNGAGKTTTLLTMVGELAPLAGEVHWLGEPIHESLHRRARRGIAFLPEEKSLVMGLSVRNNLRLASASEETVLSLFPELGPLMDRRAGLLSGGEQQMLSLGRALARSPKAVIVDELSLGLAPLVADRLVVALRAAAASGVCVLVVEQNLTRALKLADRFYLLRQGRIVLSDTADSYRGRVEELAGMLVAA